MKYKTMLTVLTLSLCVSVSCKGVSGKLLVMEGNYHSSGGRYTRAILSYQKALAHDDAAPYAQAGLGSVYYNLDEAQAALNRFEDSLQLLDGLPAAGHRELRYRNTYNSGVALFAQGNFPAAAAAFRDALRIDGSRVEAKRNLELALLSGAREKNTGGASANTPEETMGADALFEYFERREQNRWRSSEWTAEEQYEGPDY